MPVHLNQHGAAGFPNETRCDVCHNWRTVWVVPVDLGGPFQLEICKTCLQAGIDEIDAAVMGAVEEKGDD